MTDLKTGTFDRNIHKAIVQCFKLCVLPTAAEIMDGRASIDVLNTDYSDYSSTGIGNSYPDKDEYYQYGEDNFISKMKQTALYKRLIASNPSLFHTERESNKATQNAFSHAMFGHKIKNPSGLFCGIFLKSGS